MENILLNFNRLKDEKSLYLKQHEKNPIHWWAYGPNALDQAISLNKPIFLSIGYSSCHWCHVMAQDSFMNQSIADFLNQHFISIKVDREEFPDIDNYYQKAAQVFGNNGGWPLSCFLLPDMRPFYIGTFFPAVSKNGGPNFLDLIKELSRVYQNEHQQVLLNAKEVTAAIINENTELKKISFEGHFPPPNAILEAIKEFQDIEWGGYGKAPKFPHFSFYEWAIEQMLEGMINQQHGEFIISSLEKMLMGGINDHARGGIHRYSTDQKWLVPHFEKMLYDQAGFLKLLAKLSLIYPSPLVLDSLINTLHYLEDEMLSDAHLFFSAQDSDSEHVEGLYFTFSLEEFEDLLNKIDDENETVTLNSDKIKKWFQITESGNFEHQLNIISLNPEFKAEYHREENWTLIRKVRQALSYERKGRIPPATDNKGVASWNFMMISALVDVIQYSKLEVIKNIATPLLNKVTTGIYQALIDLDLNDLKIKHSTTLPYLHPYLEDYVTYAESLLRLYEFSGNQDFKNEFKKSMDFIALNFLEHDKMYTRSKASSEYMPYPNQEYNLFDGSFKSVVSTFIILSKRASVLFLDRHYLDQINSLEEKVIHTILQINPVGSGEALRAFTYPTEIFRVIKVPKTFVNLEKFKNILPHFHYRFVIDYQDDESQWQICTLSACEFKGLNIDDFVKTFGPSAQENQ